MYESTITCRNYSNLNSNEQLLLRSVQLNIMLPYPFKKNCLQILQQYDGKVPFHQYFKLTAQNHKNWGSKDRKRYKSACYGFWKWCSRELLNDEEHFFQWLEYFFENIHGGKTLQHSNQSSESQIESTGIQFVLTTENVTTSELSIPGSNWPSWSEGIHEQKWLNWFRNEAPVWIKRLHQDKSLQSGIDHGDLTVLDIKGDAISFQSNTNLDFWVEKGDIFIQDYSSQQSMEITDLMIELMAQTKAESSADQHSLQILDCCSGAGGKALGLSANLLRKAVGQSANPVRFELTCTDIRNSILHNLKERFKKTGLPLPKTQVVNWSNNENPWITDHSSTFDAVIADIPCSGSGTWRRTPEEAHFFDLAYWDTFNTTQKEMVKNASKMVKIGGYYLVLTCSVFARENELLIDNFLQEVDSEWEIKQNGFCGGDERNADFIYRTILKRKS